MTQDNELKRSILATFSPSFGGTSVPEWLKPSLDDGLGSVTLFASNTPNFESAARLIEELRSYSPNLIIAIDEEGGDVTRLFVREGSPFPTPALLGRCDDEDLTYRSYLGLGQELFKLGIDMSFAPVADVVVARENPIVAVRAFGATADLVARHTVAAVRGFQHGGIGSCIKHFPGHGAAIEDSHHQLPTVNLDMNSLLKDHIHPFIAAIEHGVDAVMVSHIIATALDDQNPSSLSHSVMHGFLRNTMKFDGLIVTDALDMGALGGPEILPQSAVRALAAGADLLCFSGDTDQFFFVTEGLRAVQAAVSSGVIPEEYLLSAAKRVLSWKRPVSLKGAIPPPVVARDLAAGLDVHGNIGLVGRHVDLIELGTAPTIAAGHVAWGMRKALAELGIACTLQTADSDSLIDKPVVVAFRDAYRDKEVLSRLKILATRYPQAIFVDLGWPTLDFVPANLIRTYGSCAAAARSAAFLMVPNN